MDFLKINENKLKITLSAAELEEWGVCAEDMDGADLRSRTLLRKLLRRAEEEVGFFTERLRTLVQLYVSRDGGCEIFVSRLPSPDDLSESLCAESPVCHGSSSAVFSFDHLAELLSVCRRLRQLGYAEASSAFRGSDKKYYLCLEGAELTWELQPSKYTFIYEYGTRESECAVRQMLREYGHLICPSDAVAQLGIL